MAMHTHTHDKTGQADFHSARAKDKKRLFLVLLLVVSYMGAEVVGGLLSNSLALLADAGHMLSDAGALALSLFALWVAQRPPTARHTYGYYRAEILAALINGVALVAIAVYVIVQAIGRLNAPVEVEGPLMTVVAVGGLLINLLGVWILQGSQSESLNVRGAWLHLLADTLGSCVALTAGALVWFAEWYWADAAGSLLIAGFVLVSAWRLLRLTVAVLMEASPSHVDVDAVRNTLMETPGVQEVHDLHVWTITSGLVALSVHVVVEDNCPYQATLQTISETLREKFNIGHTTIQLELAGFSGCEEPCQ